jgi:L-amino acid N-acyltransferase YncA
MPYPPELGALAPGLCVRAATIEDCAAICAIFNESIEMRDATADLDPKDPAFYESLMDKQVEREGFFVMCPDQDGGRGGPPHQTPALPESCLGILGWGAIKRLSDRRGYDYACETSIYLWRCLAGQGFGTMLKRAIIEQARAWRYHYLYARMYADNEASIRTNLRFGYEIIGRQREVIWLDGRWRDNVLMQLILDDVQPDTLTDSAFSPSPR